MPTDRLVLDDVRKALYDIDNPLGSNDLNDVSMLDVPSDNTSEEIEMIDYRPDQAVSFDACNQSNRASEPAQEQLQDHERQPVQDSASNNLALGDPVNIQPSSSAIMRPMDFRDTHYYQFYHISYLLSTYLQVLLNTVVVSVAIWMAFRLKKDVDLKISERMAAIERNATYCAHEYLINECRPGLRRPQLQASCQEWEACMERDPSHIGWFSAHAATLAEIFNEFIEPLSWRTLIVLLIAVVAINAVLFQVRAKTSVPNSNEFSIARRVEEKAN